MSSEIEFNNGNRMPFATGTSSLVQAFTTNSQRALILWRFQYMILITVARTIAWFEKLYQTQWIVFHQIS